MVRIKQRYLLVQILYPPSSTTSTSTPSTSSSNAAADKTLPPALSMYAPTASNVTGFTLLNLIRKQISLSYGNFGAGALSPGLAVKYFSGATSTMIVKCPRQHLRMAWGALTHVTEMRGQKVWKVGAKGEGKEKEKETEGKEREKDQEGKRKCVLRVVRVSGTMLGVQQEMVRRAKGLVDAAQAEDKDSDDEFGDEDMGSADEDGDEDEDGGDTEMG